MSEAQSVHSAAKSAVGYMYQARLALLEALRYAYRDSGIEIAVEKLDDVSFEKDGGALELLQTKHHLKKSGDLTDSSVDLWKTLRVWAETSKADPSLPRPHPFCTGYNGASAYRFGGLVIYGPQRRAAAIPLRRKPSF